MADQSIVERVARAICRAEGSDPDQLVYAASAEVIHHLGIPGRRFGTVQKPVAFKKWESRAVAASAAIAAIRNPRP